MALGRIQERYKHRDTHFELDISCYLISSFFLFPDDNSIYLIVNPFFKFSFKWINARNIFILKCWYKNIFSHFLVTELLTLSLGIYIKRQLCVFLDVKKENEKNVIIETEISFYFSEIQKRIFFWTYFVR